MLKFCVRPIFNTTTVCTNGKISQVFLVKCESISVNFRGDTEFDREFDGEFQHSMATSAWSFRQRSIKENIDFPTERSIS